MRREQSQGNEASFPPIRGILYLVGVSLGHPDDMTTRALRVLREVNVVATKRPSVTETMLAHHGVSARLTTYDRETARDKVPVLIDYLERGQSVALVSDCGMPGIYDVGELLVRAATERRITIVVVPGPSACTAGLALSGFNGNRFLFEGTVPSGKATLRRFVQDMARNDRTVVLHLRPRLVRPLLKQLVTECPTRRVMLAENLTQDRERVLRGTAQELLTRRLSADETDQLLVVIEGQNGKPTKQTGRKQARKPLVRRRRAS